MLSIIRFVKWGQADVGLMDFLLLITPLNGWSKFNAERDHHGPAPGTVILRSRWPWQ